MVTRMNPELRVLPLIVCERRSNIKRIPYPGPTLLLPLLLLFLVACGSDPLPAGIELRPLWFPGQVVEVREERTMEQGRGPFPPAGEVAARSERTERILQHYREEVLEADGVDLRRTRRTYLRSLRRDGDLAEDTPLNGKVYEIEAPFGECRIRAGDSVLRVSKGEESLARAAVLRIAASLLPGMPVEVGRTWPPGRDPRRLLALGQTGVRMEVRLAEVSEGPDGPVARVEAESVVRTATKGQPVSFVTRRETLLVDLANRRFLSWEATMEQHTGQGAVTPENWEKAVERARFTWSTR
jgi:hypothetical protein